MSKDNVDGKTALSESSTGVSRLVLDTEAIVFIEDSNVPVGTPTALRV